MIHLWSECSLWWKKYFYGSDQFPGDGARAPSDWVQLIHRHNNLAVSWEDLTLVEAVLEVEKCSHKKNSSLPFQSWQCPWTTNTSRCHFVLVVKSVRLEVAVLCVNHREIEHPFRPVLYHHNAPHLMTFIMRHDIVQRGSVKVWETVLDKHIPILHQAMNHGCVIIWGYRCHGGC